jgi:hypothetical protein
MALIYEMSTGTIVSENTGITTIENHAELPGYSMALQPAQQAATHAAPRPDDAYISLIKELLKDL